jgi:hypothetical protein
MTKSSYASDVMAIPARKIMRSLPVATSNCLRKKLATQSPTFRNNQRVRFITHPA